MDNSGFAHAPVHAAFYPFPLPAMRCAPEALEPFIDARTTRLQHDGHHRAYVDALNAAIANAPDLHDKSIEAIMRDHARLPEPLREIVRRLGGGHANHQFLWKIVGPPGTTPSPELLAAIVAAFGSFDALRSRFMSVALEHFGPGWAFLVLDPKTKKLEILSLPNNDTVLAIGKLGLFACDLWEHAYYLKYENRRADFLAAFWNVIDWDAVSIRYNAFITGGPVP